MLIYLASPYSHPDEGVRQQRFEAACKAVAELTRRGHLVFSPIAHGHAIAQAAGMETTWKTWEALDSLLLKRSNALWVLGLEGWDRSVGIRAEIVMAHDFAMDVILLDDNLETQRFL